MSQYGNEEPSKDKKSTKIDSNGANTGKGKENGKNGHIPESGLSDDELTIVESNVKSSKGKFFNKSNFE